MLSLGAVFSLFAGWYYWFGKMWGKQYNEVLGQLHFWLFFIGVNILFFPMHFLGMDGMQRRVPDYADAFGPTNHLATYGYIIMAVGMVFFFINIFWSLVAGRKAPGQSVGRRRDDARMDAVEPAALPPVRDAAEGGLSVLRYGPSPCSVPTQDERVSVQDRSS